MGPAPRAGAIDCATEQVKFVENPRFTYGNKTAMYVYNRPMDYCASVANTTFWFLAGSGFDWLEGGTRQYGHTPGKYAVFGAYNFHPLYHYQEGGLIADTSETVSFLTANETGTSYRLKIQYGLGEVPSYYATVLVTPYAPYNFGTPMSEISRYGNADVPAHITSMKYRRVTGEWPYWDGLRCSFPNSIWDWDGVKAASGHAWDVLYRPVQVGGC